MIGCRLRGAIILPLIIVMFYTFDMWIRMLVDPKRRMPFCPDFSNDKTLDDKRQAFYRTCIAFTIMTAHQAVQIT